MLQCIYWVVSVSAGIFGWRLIGGSQCTVYKKRGSAAVPDSSAMDWREARCLAVRAYFQFNL